LNAIKQRESYRPIAPVCLEASASTWFDLSYPSPHMLYLVSVRSDRLAAVRHVDGSARLQTVNRDQNPALHDLLLAFEALCGVPVLCNTSLNQRGRGFINRLSDLMHFATERGLDGFVVGDRFFRRLS
jgi:hydroxymethyl cephem carbamoyltransferase